MIKTCPYCSKRLPFFNLIGQRLTFSETKALHCAHCRSVISANGGASMWLPLSCSICSGYLLVKLLGGLSLATGLWVCGIGLLVFILSSYFTAPIRSA